MRCKYNDCFNTSVKKGVEMGENVVSVGKTRVNRCFSALLVASLAINLYLCDIKTSKLGII